MAESKIPRILEITRWVLVVIGFQIAFYFGKTPVENFHLMMPWIVGALCGLSGFESFFFGKIASKVTGYADGGGGYQRQSGINNLAVGFTAILVYFLNWGLYADATITMVMMLFLGMSATNHAYSAWKEGNRGLRNIMRPVMTLLLLAFLVPLMIRALTYSA